ncbi:MAG: hypothetical protein IPG12_09265 [Saprospiraceae bacterium]|nr:hypothetical protein [Saprospiraceae bacterium]
MTHNKDYDLPTPDSIAFKNVCLIDGSFYEGLDYSGSSQAIKDGKQWNGFATGSYSKQTSRYSIAIYSVNSITRLPIYSMNFQKIDSIMFKNGNIITDIDTTWIPYQSKKFYIESATLIADGIVNESYCINNKVTKPNFLK